MRLIDADALIAEIESLSVHITGLRAGKGILANFMDEYRKSVLKIIEEQPTAYDVEKVIEQLEEEEEYSYADFEEYAYAYELDLSEYDDWYCQGLKRAITLLKRGVKK